MHQIFLFVEGIYFVNCFFGSTTPSNCKTLRFDVSLFYRQQYQRRYLKFCGKVGFSVTIMISKQCLGKKILNMYLLSNPLIKKSPGNHVPTLQTLWYFKYEQ